MSGVINIHRCPICKKVYTDTAYVPFCSKRCADVDLGRWFMGNYAVASEDLDELEIEELGEALADAHKADK